MIHLPDSWRRCSRRLFRRWVVPVAIVAAVGPAQPLWSQHRQAVTIRGHQQSLFIYGSPQGEPVIVSSGDGGWMHLGPHVADYLSARGFFVIGFDVKHYLADFTSGGSTLRPEEEPADYRVLTDVAKRATGKKPILIGVSEGAGLSVLAATDAATKADIAGVIGVGLPDLNELGWRWKDMLIAQELGIKLENVTPEHLGRASRIVLDREHTTIIGGKGDRSAIAGRCQELRKQIVDTTSDYDREKLEERLAKLSGGVAVIRVGAPSEAEMKSRHEAFDDAIHATRAAVAEGVVPGAGLALLRAIPAVDAEAARQMPFRWPAYYS